MIDATYVINLDRRPDRLREFYRSYPAILPIAERISATDGRETMSPDGLPDRAAWGCWDSHRRILAQCVSMGAKSVLIFEDDAYPRPGFATSWRDFQEYLPSDWQFVFLGGSPRGNTPYKRVNEKFLIPLGVRTTHAYMVREPFLSFLLAKLQPPRPTEHIDVLYEERLPGACTVGFYCPDRWLFGQSQGSSDIASVWLDKREFRDPIDIHPVRYVTRQQPCDQDATGRCRRKRCGRVWSSVCAVGNGLMDTSA